MKCLRTDLVIWSHRRFERVVSSYLRTANHTQGFPEMQHGGSFLDFLTALAQRAKLSPDKQQALADIRKADHVLPQRRACDTAPGITLIPLECEAAAFAVLPASPLNDYNSTKFASGSGSISTKHHYQVKAPANTTYTKNVPALPYAELKRNGVVPNYAEFYAHDDVRLLVARLFAADLELYTHACHQLWLLEAGACNDVCRRVLEWPAKSTNDSVNCQMAGSDHGLMRY